LVIRYPNGKPYHSNPDKSERKNQAKRMRLNRLSYGNRGMNLEEAINRSIAYYRKTDQAVLHKKPTPIQIVHVDYPKRSAAKITEAYFRKASTTDYNGVYKGRYIDFEAKETKNKTSFPLKNFHQHQIDHMLHCYQQNGIIFVLLYFSSLNRYFILEAKILIQFWNKQFTDDGNKSIRLESIEELGYEIQEGISPRIPFLPVLDQLISQQSIE